MFRRSTFSSREGQGGFGCWGSFDNQVMGQIRGASAELDARCLPRAFVNSTASCPLLMQVLILESGGPEPTEMEITGLDELLQF